MGVAVQLLNWYQFEERRGKSPEAYQTFPETREEQTGGGRAENKKEG